MIEVNKTYSFDNIFACMIGAIATLMFVFILGTKININPLTGFSLTLGWIFLMYYGLRRMNFNKSDAIIHVIFDYFICLVVAIGFSLIFGQVTTIQEIYGFQLFGSFPAIACLMALSVGISFEINDCRNVIIGKKIIN